jgi:hypothetical protein
LKDVCQKNFTKTYTTGTYSVADPGFLSRIPDPDFTHPGSATEERSEKNFVVIPFQVAKNFTKL